MKDQHIIVMAARLNIPVNRAAELVAVCRFEHIKKHTRWIQAGTPYTDLAYIVEGAVRTFGIDDDGRDISYLLQVNNDFTGDFESFITNGPSSFHIETILDTHLLLISRAAIQNLIQRDPFWLHFRVQMSDLAFTEAKRRIEDLLLYTPEQRYSNLLDRSPEIIRKIPQKYISSYLGIQPPSLSRIRKRLIN